LFDVIADPNPSTGSIILIENGDTVLDALFLQNYININLGNGTIDAYNQNDPQTKEIDFSTLIDHAFVSPKVFLQGPLLNPATPGLMNDDLRVQNLLPSTSPYADGLAVIGSPFVATGNDAIVDWVWVELRDANNNTQVVSAQSALLQRDGDVVSLDGVSNLKFVVDSSADYYLVIEHRNHLGVMSANPIALSGNETIIDFTDSTTATYGTNAQAILSNGALALWRCNANNDDIVRYIGADNDINSIKDAVLAHPDNTSLSNFYPYTGYDDNDLNLDGIVRYLGPGNDTNVVKDIVLAHPGNTSNSNFFPFSSQVPN